MLASRHLFVAFGLMSLTGCRSCVPEPVKTLAHMEKHNVKELIPLCDELRCQHRYAYKDDKGYWWVYYVMFSSGQTAPTDALPGGGAWTRIKDPPSKEEVRQDLTLSLEPKAIVDVDAPIEVLR
jgi:hypothetical protein